MSTGTTLSPQQIWNDILEIVKSKIPVQSFNTWLKATKGVELDDDIFKVSVPNKFTANWIADKFQCLIADALSARLGSPRRIEYINVDCQPPPIEADLAPRAKPIPAARRSSESHLSPRYLFDNFVVGDSNRFAHAAAQAVARAPMQTKYNPLYIYGGVGLGKTHLAQAIGNFVREHFTDLKVLYVTSEKFTSDFIDAIANQKTADFAKLYRGVDLLLLDDIQFFTRKEATQEQFFHTFNALHQGGKQIILTSDRSPREIKGLEDRLLSRFQSGLVADIQPPDLETRIAILQQIVQLERQSVSFDVLTFIARNITHNIRELQGSIVRLIAYGSVTGRDLNLTLTQEVLKDSLESSPPVNVELITEAVCRYFKLAPEQVCSKRKTADLVRARQIAMYLARKHTSGSLKSIGEAFGRRDHSTVIHSLGIIDTEAKVDPTLRAAIEAIESLLQNPACRSK